MFCKECNCNLELCFHNPNNSIIIGSLIQIKKHVLDMHLNINIIKSIKKEEISNRFLVYDIKYNNNYKTKNDNFPHYIPISFLIYYKNKSIWIHSNFVEKYLYQ